MILVDTSIWVEHLRRRHEGLAALLNRAEVVVHPFVLGEIALGALTHRATVLDLLAALPSISPVSHEEVLEAIERRGLAASGVGWVDAHLLASALVHRLPFWTLDRRLNVVARRLDVAWRGATG